MSTIRAEIGLIHGAGFEFVEEDDRTIQVISAASARQATKGAELLVDGNVEVLLCTGRGPLSDETYEASEAQLMADYLVRGGIDADQIVLEDQSHSTLENWVNSAEVIDILGHETVIGVARGSQAIRSQMIGNFVAKNFDFEIKDYTRSSTLDKPKDIVRETISTALTYAFIRSHEDTPVDELVEEYQRFMSKVGGDKAKRFLHRRGNSASY